MIVSPVTVNGVDMYHVSMTDTYNFNYESDFFGGSTNFWEGAERGAIVAGNNLAYFDMAIGVINEFKIEIDFFVTD